MRIAWRVFWAMAVGLAFWSAIFYALDRAHHAAFEARLDAMGGGAAPE